MPQNNVTLEIDQGKLLFLLERDFPSLQEDIKDIKQDIIEVKELLDNHSNDLVFNKGKTEDLIKTFAELKERNTKEHSEVIAELSAIKTLSSKETLWYKKFENILILLLLGTVMGLVGVQDPFGIIKKFTPIPEISQTEEK